MSASSSADLADEFEISSFDVAGFAANALHDWQSLAAILDHTLLRADATSADVLRLCEEAVHYRFACVSVNPCWIALAHSALSGSGLPVGSVIGFPLGASLTHNKREEGESALRLGARELDMVIHIGALKSGDNATVQSDVRTMAELVHDAGGTLKAITTHIKPGYLRNNGVPFSANAVMTEYYDLHRRGNDDYLVQLQIVEDPKYLNAPWVVSNHFRREADGSKWDPEPCELLLPNSK